jgi:hypothetical protein
MMKWILVIMIWVSSPVPEENDAISLSRARIFDSYEACFDTAKKVVATVNLIPGANDRTNIICRPTWDDK